MYFLFFHKKFLYFSILSEKFGIMFDDLAYMLRKNTFWFFPFFLLFRAMMFLVQIQAFMHPYLKLGILIQLLWIPYVFWYGNVKPHVNRNRRIIEYFNMFMFLILIYHYYSFAMTNENQLL